MAKYCGNCGTMLADSARFCTECGAPFPEDEELYAPPQAVEVPADAAPAAQVMTPPVHQTAGDAAQPYGTPAQEFLPMSPAPAVQPAPKTDAAAKKKVRIVAAAVFAAVILIGAAVFLLTNVIRPGGTAGSPEDVVTKLSKLYTGTADTDEIASLIYEYNYPLNGAAKDEIRSTVANAVSRSKQMNASASSETVTVKVVESEKLTGEEKDDAIRYFGRSCRTDSIDEIRYMTVRMSLSSDSSVSKDVTGFYIKADGKWYLNLSAAL